MRQGTSPPGQVPLGTASHLRTALLVPRPPFCRSLWAGIQMGLLSLSSWKAQDEGEMRRHRRVRMHQIFPSANRLQEGVPAFRQEGQKGAGHGGLLSRRPQNPEGGV